MIECTETQDVIVCPHCGYEHDDSDFLVDDCTQGETWCNECSFEFSYTSQLTIKWTTSK